MKAFVLIISIAVFAISCGPQHMVGGTRLIRHEIIVDSFGNDLSLNRKDCFIYVADSLIEINTLQHRELYVYLEKIFNNRGYNIVENIDNANVVIFLNYGISDPYIEEYERIIPIWGYSGAYTTTTGRVQLNRYSNSVSYSETSVTRPMSSIQGYQTVTAKRRSYLRFINLVAYDLDYFAEHERESLIWKTTITNIKDCDDLRKIFPHMLVAAEDYIGRSSGEKRKIYVGIYDEKVTDLRGY